MKASSSSRTVGVAVVFGWVLVAGCTRSADGGAPAAAASPAPPSDATSVVATVGDSQITRAELDQAAANELDDLEQQRFRIVSGYLTRLVQERLWDLEAKSRGTTVAQLLKVEVDDKVEAPTPEEIDALLANDQYKRVLESRLAGVQDDAEKQKRTDSFRQQLQTRMMSERRDKRMQAFTEEVRARRPVSIALKPPVPKRVEVAVGDSPVRGAAGAPVTIIEFSDFQCPFCGRAEPTLAQLSQQYGDKIRLVYKHFPLGMHPFAQKAAEASECAGEKGKFWELHDLLYANQQALEVDKLVEYAEKIGLDGNDFRQCVESGRMEARIKKDVEAGANAGVQSTPSFFVNGVKVRGAQGVDFFKEIIDGELGDTKKS